MEKVGIENAGFVVFDRDKAVPATAGTVFQPGDKLTVFGNYHTICSVFETQERFTMD